MDAHPTPAPTPRDERPAPATPREITTTCDTGALVDFGDGVPVVAVVFGIECGMGAPYRPNYTGTATDGHRMRTIYARDRSDVWRPAAVEGAQR